uniref:WW domain-containing protein n=1 Tax=Alexandrium monilatum TaxID=311494 RepID=A0A7S4SJI5_9DINO|mmetsp:Transcript_104735/g.312857  ORF Transcript_104735/g.312857 Transcript_104735/m.312857 type:complete len:355 (+) Transcript_104735:146-1210(+)|eukprot:CAMPEP_0175296790 /NCGR_PEP_ID=MMETSP0093-20121207/59224_1 /TAXON_ID=311494 /ORGANISM="Alexandrium monilatum, Strain CCMP3105" /LENGTH=354 /DNA_ID=CAMNT_0016592825 /DNA_START=146 /DNA_END=1210 /DNA_ORIENTATION=+
MAMKGGGKGKGNLPGMPGSTLDGLPGDGVAIFREGAEQAVEFCEQLRNAMVPYAQGKIHFDNLDVSNVQWPLMNFSLLLDVLQEKAASTKRLKAFKAGLDDECLGCLAGWIEQLPPESLPLEIHLSHNNITQRGLDVLLTAIEGKRALLTQQALPIWLRLETNKVDISPQSSVMKPLVEQGRVVLVAHIRDRVPGDACVAMPSFIKPSGGQGWQQNSPAVMALPAATTVPGMGASWNAGYAGSPWWGNGGAGGGYGGASYGGASWWNQGHIGYQQKGPSWAGMGGWPQPAAQYVAPQQSQGGGRTADRSRTPAARNPGGTKLPPGWEEHFSDEYKIPYYWNTQTGESLWEPPEE